MAGKLLRTRYLGSTNRLLHGAFSLLRRLSYLLLTPLSFFRFSCLFFNIQGARPALCEDPSSGHMREYHLRCLVESLLADRLREATTGGTAEKPGESLVLPLTPLVVLVLVALVS